MQALFHRCEGRSSQLGIAISSSIASARSCSGRLAALEAARAPHMPQPEGHEEAKEARNPPKEGSTHVEARTAPLLTFRPFGLLRPRSMVQMADRSPARLLPGPLGCQCAPSSVEQATANTSATPRRRLRPRWPLSSSSVLFRLTQLKLRPTRTLQEHQSISSDLFAADRTDGGAFAGGDGSIGQARGAREVASG